MDWCPVQGESKTLIRLTLHKLEFSLAKCSKDPSSIGNVKKGDTQHEKKNQYSSCDINLTLSMKTTEEAGNLFVERWKAESALLEK